MKRTPKNSYACILLGCTNYDKSASSCVLDMNSCCMEESNKRKEFDVEAQKFYWVCSECGSFISWE